jgi:hypothetical protein
MAAMWAIVLAVAVAVAAAIWAWRYWALRTWRTLAVVASGALVAAASIVGLPSPYGFLAATAIGGFVFWLLASAPRLLRAISEADYSYADHLWLADQEAAMAISRVGQDLNPREVTASLERVLDRLETTPPPSDDWERARSLKIQELRLAHAILSGASDDPAADMARQQEARAEAYRVFMAVRRGKTSFWRVPRRGETPDTATSRK